MGFRAREQGWSNSSKGATATQSLTSSSAFAAVVSLPLTPSLPINTAEKTHHIPQPRTAAFIQGKVTGTVTAHFLQIPPGPGQVARIR